MDFKQLIEIGDKLKLEGTELLKFVRHEQEQQRAKEEAAIQHKERELERMSAKEEMESKMRREDIA